MGRAALGSGSAERLGGHCGGVQQPLAKEKENELQTNGGKKNPNSGPCSSVSGSASERCVSTWAMGSASREAPDGPLQAPISALCSLGRSRSGWERSAGWLWAIPASRRWMGRGKGSLGLGVPARAGAPGSAGLQQQPLDPVFLPRVGGNLPRCVL